MNFPYDGGAIGAFQSFGTMGRPDRNNRIYLASEAADGPNRNFFPRMLTGQEIIPGAMLTMPYDGELRIFCHGVVLTHHTPILTVNGEMVHRGTTYGYYSDWLTFHTDVKAGDNVLLHIWSSTTETLPQNGQSYAMLYLRVHDKGSISANSYMTY
jgi:hypothetical protein